MFGHHTRTRRKLKHGGAGLFVLLLASALAASAQEDAANLAPNPGFELPAGQERAIPDQWSFFTTKTGLMGVTTARSRGGQQCLKITAQEAPRENQGLLLDLPVAEGEKYWFSVYALNNRDDPLGGTAHGSLVIEWVDGNNREIGRSNSGRWDATASRVRWERYSIDGADVPAGVVRARFGIHLDDAEAGGTGSILLDDVMIRKE